GAARATIESCFATFIEVAMEARSKMAVRAVVPEVAAVPIATVKASSEVAEAVVNAAVIADGATPVARMPVVQAAVPTPPAGRPESVFIGREHPGAVYPVVAVRSPGP